MIDWNKIAKVNFDDNRRKVTGGSTMKEKFQKGREQLQAQENRAEFMKKSLPILKNALLMAITSKTPILLKSSVNNPTETLGGISKNEEDEFPDFYNSSPSMQNDGSNAKFEEVMETIPAGTALIFKSFDKTLDQFIFKGSNGQDYAIYTKDKVAFRGQVIENPGLFGIMYHSDLMDSLNEDE